MTDESSKVKEAVARGKQRFFELHPRLLQEAEAIAEQNTEIPATRVSEMQEVAKYRSIARVAKALGKDSLMLLIELGANSKEEFDQIIAAQNIEIKRSIGI